MYNPDLLKQEYEQLEHGKTRISGIYEAIKQADENNDVPFQLYFRIALCDESDWYADSLDMFVVFPKLLALADKHPDAPSTVYNNNYENAMAHILWVYKWLINDCSEFYQISKADWEMFLEDFKERTVAFGYSLREYYKYKHQYYEYFGDNELAEKYFELFRNAPRNRNSDCKACDQLGIVKKYLNNNELEKAQREAVVLETRQLSCGNGRSWLRLQNAYMCYYMRNKEFDKVEKYIRLIHRYDNGEIEFDISDEEILYYSYTDISKALKIYKREWKEWLTQKNPNNRFYDGKRVCVFFKKLMESRKTDTIKLKYDTTFPLYREDNTYKISDLYDFYYKFTSDIADKFNKRNGNDKYTKELENAINDIIEF